MAIDPKQFVIDPKKASKEDLAAAMELLAQKKYREARIEAGEIKGTYTKKWSEMTPEEKEKARQLTRKRNAKVNVLVRKAIEAGFTCTEAEIDAEIQRMKAGRSEE